MKRNRVIIDQGKYADEFVEQERAKAIDLIKNADDFVVIVRKGTEHNCVSAVTDCERMAFDCYLASEELRRAFNEKPKDK